MVRISIITKRRRESTNLGKGLFRAGLDNPRPWTQVGRANRAKKESEAAKK